MLGIVLEELDSLVNDHHILSKEEAAILKAGIVHTILPGSDAMEHLARVSAVRHEEKYNWLLKPVGSGKGKGKGIIFGSDVTTEEWTKSLQRLLSPHVQGQNYVVQRVVEQPNFGVVVPVGNTQSDILCQPFVGSSLIINGRYLGFGLWRTSWERICAVSRGGAWMCSLMLDNDVEKSSHDISPRAAISWAKKSTFQTAADVARITVKNLDFSTNSSHIQHIHENLQSNGIAILDLSFTDPFSDYLAKMVDSLTSQHGHNPPLQHSKTRGTFWDVKPSPESVTQPFHARSETMQDFQWHTDCSYAIEPPCYFALQVLQADRYGGGTLSILELRRVLEKLTQDTVDALRAEEYRIDVPPEFANGTEYIIGAILSMQFGETERGQGQSEHEVQPRIRFRADIVTAQTKRASKALGELKQVLEEAWSSGKGNEMCMQLTPEVIPTGSVVVLHNGRWLHARNALKDPERHLRRIRWDARKF